MFRFQGILLIQLITFLIGWQTLYAQQVPWNFTPSSLSHTIFIAEEHAPLINGVPLDSGDYIGVFYSNDAGLLVNGGFTQWKGIDTYITAYGDDGYVDGFKTGEEFTFKIWRNNQGCTILDYQVEYLSSGLYTSTGSFAQNGISGILSWTGNEISITYPKSVICTNEEDIGPQFSSEINIDFPIDFQAEEGLAINSSTGLLTVGQSEPGDYIILMNTEICLSDNQYPITINRSPNIEIPDEVYGCDSVHIELPYIPGYLYSWSTGENTPDISGNNSGDYTLEVSNEFQCVEKKTIKAIVSTELMIDNLEFQYNIHPCAKEGQIIIDTNSLSGGILPFSYQLMDESGNVTVSYDGVFDNILLGNYQLFIEDSISCVSDVIGISLNNYNNCDELVIVPNSDLNNSLYIEESGRARIFNRNGIMCYEMNVPAFWDGSDSSGEVLPMGAYVVTVNDKKKYVVTIIK